MGSLQSTVSYVLAAAGTVVCGVLAALFYYQRAIIYPAGIPPNSRATVMRPSEFSMPLYDDVTLTAGDGVRVRAYLIRQERSRECPTVVFFHANAGNMGDRLPIAKILYETLRCNVFLLSYRGYGYSEGTPSQAGLRLDVDAALTYLRESADVDARRLIAYGQSLGGSVAIDTAARHADAFRALVVENMFTSLPELVPHVMPYLKFFTAFVLDKWDSESAIRKVTCPILFLSGSRDQLIPPSMMLRLFEAAGTPNERKELVRFPNGDHNNTVLQLGYFDAFARFYRSVFPASAML